jgi:hypothetical protein
MDKDKRTEYLQTLERAVDTIHEIEGSNEQSPENKGPTDNEKENAVWKTHLDCLKEMIQSVGGIDQKQIEDLLTAWLKDKVANSMRKAYRKQMGQMELRYPYCGYLWDKINRQFGETTNGKAMLKIIKDYCTKNDIHPERNYEELMQVIKFLKDNNAPTDNEDENKIWAERLKYLQSFQDDAIVVPISPRTIFPLLDGWLKTADKKFTRWRAFTGGLDDRFIYIQYFVNNLKNGKEKKLINDDDKYRNETAMLTVLKEYCIDRQIPEPIDPKIPEPIKPS